MRNGGQGSGKQLPAIGGPDGALPPPLTIPRHRGDLLVKHQIHGREFQGHGGVLALVIALVVQNGELDQVAARQSADVFQTLGDIQQLGRPTKIEMPRRFRLEPVVRTVV